MTTTIENTKTIERMMEYIDQLEKETARVDRRLTGDLRTLTERLEQATSALTDPGNLIAVGDYRIINPHLTAGNPWANFMAVRSITPTQSATFAFTLEDDFEADSWPERPYLTFEARIASGLSNQILEASCNGQAIFDSSPDVSWRTHMVVLDNSILQPGTNRLAFTHGGGAPYPAYDIQIATTILHFQRSVLDGRRIAEALGV